MLKTDAVILDYNAITPYGDGIDLCWQGLLHNQTAIIDTKRFDTSNFASSKAATIRDLVLGDEKSLVFQMLQRLKNNITQEIPEEADLILASLNGEIDFIERAVLEGDANIQDHCLNSLLVKTRNLFSVKGKSILVSSACTSSSVAIARAAALIKSGKSDCILVVSCDCVSEFLVSGFSSLGALDKKNARPFDKNREGINAGEAAAYVLLMSGERSEKEHRDIKGKVLGWGMSCDANHITGPSVNGEGLYLSIKRALAMGAVEKESIDSICAHGTGTVYNDAMEIKGFKEIFFDNICPTYSIKGGIGHTMGAAGMMDALIALETMKNNVVPPTVGVEEIEEEAKGWIKKEKVELKNNVVLSTNSGFGGINSALIMTQINKN
ncbi:MAG: beta-ketoacyl-[acyl-carrier-protein] synthase family protein [Planctomycetes bacterium]|nr:beta-ketoacyl-[acyl-carrier-protein] synthase family protein [Planctomycetota bacterium]